MENPEEGTIISRLKQFIESCALSNSQFADKAGIPRPTLSQLINGRNKSINDLLLRKLHDSFPDLNVSWLLFGSGNMRNDVNIEISEGQNKPNSATINLETPDNKDVNTLFDQVFTHSPELGIEKETQKKQIFEQPDRDGIIKEATNGLKLPSPSHGKKIKSIIVLYTDSSFEVFSPDKAES